MQVATALSVSSQSGLASMVMALITAGLGIDWLTEHPRNLAAVTVEKVHEAAARYLAPGRAVTIVVGDLAGMQVQVEALGPIVVA